MNGFSDLTPEQRATALYYFFGQKGGTAHQLAASTGLTVKDILHREHGPERLSGGFSAVRTCSPDWRRDTLAPKHQGDWPFWRDAIVGYWITGALS
jgi:hypothetical protein